MFIPKSALQDLLIMAYNVGREHEKNNTMTIEEGRKITAEALIAFYKKSKKQ